MKTPVNEKTYCARCSAAFYIFEEDAALADQLCVGCYTELTTGIESIDMAPMPNVNDLVFNSEPGHADRQQSD